MRNISLLRLCTDKDHHSLARSPFSPVDHAVQSSSIVVTASGRIYFASAYRPNLSDDHRRISLPASCRPPLPALHLGGQWSRQSDAILNHSEQLVQSLFRVIRMEPLEKMVWSILPGEPLSYLLSFVPFHIIGTTFSLKTHLLPTAFLLPSDISTSSQTSFSRSNCISLSIASIHLDRSGLASVDHLQHLLWSHKKEVASLLLIASVLFTLHHVLVLVILLFHQQLDLTTKKIDTFSSLDHLTHFQLHNSPH